MQTHTRCVTEIPPTQTHDEHKKTQHVRHYEIEEYRPVRCILGVRGWVGLTHLGTSWEPQQDLQGRRRIIYLKHILIYIRQSAVHMQGHKHSQGQAI